MEINIKQNTLNPRGNCAMFLVVCSSFAAASVDLTKSRKNAVGLIKITHFILCHNEGC